jgi:hypothetical protein
VFEVRQISEVIFHQTLLSPLAYIHPLQVHVSDVLDCNILHPAKDGELPQHPNSPLNEVLEIAQQVSTSILCHGLLVSVATKFLKEEFSKHHGYGAKVNPVSTLRTTPKENFGIRIRPLCHLIGCSSF